MTVQWIALAITSLLAAISIITGLYQSGQSQKAAAASEKARADMAGMKLDIIEKIGATLQDFVRGQQLKDYIEGHSKEHLRLEQELTRLRDWKEDTDGGMRKTSNTIHDVTAAVDDIKKMLRDLKDKQQATT